MTLTPDDTLQKVQAFFRPGTIGGKIDEAVRLQAAGDTMLFDGGCSWRIELVEEEKALKGKSESLDAAFSDITACLRFLLENNAPETQVLCAIRLEEGTSS